MRNNGNMDGPADMSHQAVQEAANRRSHSIKYCARYGIWNVNHNIHNCVIYAARGRLRQINAE